MRTAGRFVASLILGVFYVAGLVAGVVVVAVLTATAAVRLGWADARKRGGKHDAA